MDDLTAMKTEREDGGEIKPSKVSVSDVLLAGNAGSSALFVGRPAEPWCG